jgi:hypothetical protein
MEWMRTEPFESEFPKNSLVRLLSVLGLNLSVKTPFCLSSVFGAV